VTTARPHNAQPPSPLPRLYVSWFPPPRMRRCVDAACGAFSDVLRSFGGFSSTTLSSVPVGVWREAQSCPSTGGAVAAFPPGASGLDLSVEERVNRSLALLTAGEACRSVLQRIATGPRGSGNVVLATEALAAYETWRGGVPPAALAAVASIASRPATPAM